MAPESDLFFLVGVLECFVGELGGNDNGKYGENEALNTHDDINNSKMQIIDSTNQASF